MAHIPSLAQPWRRASICPFPLAKRREDRA